MRAVIQRVSEASVMVGEEMVSEIGAGLLILLGIEDADEHEDVEWLSRKLSNLRIFNDAENQMNHSITDVDGELLVVSQFTLHGSTKKGNRPSFMRAAKPMVAEPMFEKFVKYLEVTAQRPVKTGVFGAEMQVTLVNDGPVTIIMDTKNRE